MPDNDDLSGVKEALDEILGGAFRAGASDVHIQVGEPYLLRIGPDILRSENYPALTRDIVESTLASITSIKQQEIFQEMHEYDFSYSTEKIPDARFRVNVALENLGPTLTFRIIPQKIKPVEDIGFPADYFWQNILALPRGLVLVTGVTGSGKSTTLASLIQRLNEERNEKTITIEDPIEFLYKNQQSIIVQREVGRDTASFYNGVKWALRQDPDNILIGEIRDRETARAAITAAETGHLVFSTLHTKDATGTILRYIDMFKPEEQPEVKSSLADNLTYVICQQLVPYEIREKRALAMEIMQSTDAIRALIRKGDPHQIPNYIEHEGSGIKMDRHLERLFKDGKIERDVALNYAIDKVALAKVIDR